MMLQLLLLRPLALPSDDEKPFTMGFPSPFYLYFLFFNAWLDVRDVYISILPTHPSSLPHAFLFAVLSHVSCANLE